MGWDDELYLLTKTLDVTKLYLLQKIVLIYIFQDLISQSDSEESEEGNKI